MAIYLFMLLTVATMLNMTYIVWDYDRWKRTGSLIGTLISIPPYIWFGWCSGLVF